MKELTLTTRVILLTAAELNEEENSLMKAALDAASKAYAPYSGFHVGAALRLSGGEIIQGNNQENAAYPSGICAERTALYYAGASKPEETVDAIAIVAVHKGEVVGEISPCGACRQVMIETYRRQGKAFKVYLIGREEIRLVPDCRDLLLFSFGSGEADSPL